MFIFLDSQTTGTGPEDRLCQIAFKPEGEGLSTPNSAQAGERGNLIEFPGAVACTIVTNGEMPL